MARRIFKIKDAVHGATSPAMPDGLQSTLPRRTFQNFFFAIACLVLVAALAFGTMLGVAALIEHFEPTHRFDIYLALHKPLVLGLLTGLSVLWVLPPYPWIAEQHRARRRIAFRRVARRERGVTAS